MAFLKNLFFLIFYLSHVNAWCPLGWQDTSKDVCYKFHDPSKAKSWDDARESCIRQGGELASIRKDSHKNWFYNEIQKRNVTYDWWIGYNKQSGSTWTWSDSTPVNPSYILWQPGYPKNENTAKCAAAVSRPCACITNADCSKKKGYICIRKKNDVVRCHVDWEEFDGSCYKYFSTPRSWPDAERDCNDQGANLPWILDEHENGFVADWTRAYGTDTWIGLRSDNFGTFSWSRSGASLSFRAWKPGEPKTQDPQNQPNLTCTRITNVADFLHSWATQRCDGRRPFLCRKAVGECPPGWRIHQDNCYEYHTTDKLSWPDAKTYCERRGAMLLTIDDKGEQTFIDRRLRDLNDAGVLMLWLGLSDNQTNQDYRWVTGKRVADGYKKWASGQPRPRSGIVTVGQIFTGNNIGYWSTTANLLQQHGFVCKVLTGTDVSPILTPPPNFRCPGDMILHQAECYQVIDTENNWDTARQRCRDIHPKADLARIKTVMEQDFVNTLDFNDNTWIGLNNVMPPWHWLDDTTDFVDFHNWDEGFPHSNEGKCAIMVNTGDRKGMWRNKPCSEQHSAVCMTKELLSPTGSPITREPWTPKCGPFWEDDVTTEYCYQFNNQFVSWTDAQTQCRDSGGEIASITSSHEQRFITGKTRGMTGIRLWIGMNDRDTQYVWKWADDSPAAFFNWEAGKPDRYGSNRGDCGAMVLSNSLWVNPPCATQYGFICKKRGNVPTTMPPPTTTPNIPPGMEYGCYPGWRDFGNRCYLAIVTAPNTWQDARDQCRRRGGDLVSIGSEAEENFVSALAREAYTKPIWRYTSYWIGLNELDTAGVYVWSDSSKVTYTHWDEHEPNNYGTDGEPCVAMYIQTGGWNDIKCEANSKHVGYLCEAGKRPVPTKSAGGGCPTGYTYSYKCSCYRFGREAKSWADARTECQKVTGGELVDILDRFEQAYLSSVMAQERGPHWIGLTNVGAADKRYRWTSNRVLSYTNWYQDFTGNEENKCASMQSGIPVGLWKPEDCSGVLQYICEAPKPGCPTDSPPVTDTPPNYCITGWQYQNGYCYKAFMPNDLSQRLTWMEAGDYCRAMNTELVSIHSSEENAFVGQLISGWHRAPLFWIGLNHRSSTRGQHWTDGTPDNYQAWKSGEPHRYNGTFNCVALDMRLDQWAYYNCDVVQNWFCKVPSGTPIITPTTPPTPGVSPSCGANYADWKYFQGDCYYISKTTDGENQMSWFEARDFCMQKGGDLVSVHTLAEATMLATELSKSDHAIKVWIGLNELRQRGTYEWSDGSERSLLRWSPGEPNDFHYGERCCNMYKSNGLWNDDNCALPLGFICRKPNITAVPRTVTPSAVVPGFCPKGYFGVGNKCFAVFGMPGQASTTQLSWTQAADFCRRQYPQQGSDIASILKEEENAIIVAHMSLWPNNYGLWIGLHDEVNPNTWVWADNSPVLYTNWNKREPDKPDEHCAEIVSTPHKMGKWNDLTCSYERGFVCHVYKDGANIVNTPPSLPDNGQNCKAGYTPYWKGCYKVVTTQMTWDKAQEACAADGGNLVSIHTEPENAAVWYFGPMTTKQPAWIGLNDKRAKGVYVWSDGWLVDFSKWGSGQPTRGDENQCISMNEDGRWYNNQCNTGLQFICKTTIETVPTTPDPNLPGACPGADWVPRDRSCYLFMGQPYKSWQLAEFECVQSQGHLASITDAGENAWLKTQLESRAIQKNAWIGMLRTGTGSGWGWVDQSPVSHTEWAEGEPNNDERDENCVEFYWRQAQWNDNNCNAKRAFICKAPKQMKTTTQPNVGPSISSPSSSATPPVGPSNRVSGAGSSTTLSNLQPNPPQRQGGPGLSEGGKVGVAFAVLIIICAVLVVSLVMLKRRGTPLLNRGVPTSFASPVYQAAQPSSREHVDISGKHIVNPNYDDVQDGSSA